MDITIQGIYGSPSAARPIVQTIQQQLGTHAKASVISKGAHPAEERLPTQSNRALAFTLAGGAFGMFLGSLIAALFPIADEHLLRETMMAAVLGAITGALLGYFTGGVMLASAMTADAQNATQVLEQGDVVLRVEVEPDEAAQVCQILIASGARRSDGTPGVERSDDIAVDRAIA